MPLLSRDYPYSMMETKQMSGVLEKTYNPKDVEERIYRMWEETGCFNPDAQKYADKTQMDAEENRRKSAFHLRKSAFSMVLPPPNATGILHMGHALMLTIQDVMVRYHRMKGEKTLWLPGTDHAAIATPDKVER